jgi:phenylacetate-coenzyme A ligase PaaK-like adenylate-forming protein
MNIRGFIEARALSAANRHLCREGFERKRLSQFRKFACYIQRKSPWYAQIISEQKIDPAHSRPEQFPVLTKSVFIEHFDQIVTSRNIQRSDVENFVQRSRDPADLFHGKYTVIKTSGSSGETGYCIYSPAAWARTLAQLAVSSEFCFWGKKRVAFFGGTRAHFAGVTTCLSLNRWPLSLIYQARGLDINLAIEDVVGTLNRFQPHMVLGYGNALRILAEEQLKGQLRISPDSISNGGELLRVADRQAIESVYGKCMRDAYASSEFGLMGLREPTWNSMRLMEDYLFFEMQSDHILVTSTANELMPLVRYRMNDVLLPVASDEHLPYASISEVIGRAEETARFLNRRGEVDGIRRQTLEAIMIPGVRRLQMRVRSRESFDFALEMFHGTGAAAKNVALQVARRELDAMLREKHMENVTFDIFPVPELPVDSKSGKFRIIIYENVAGL